MGKIAIVGAGLSGLVAALELARRGEEVVVVERAPVVGGLARSFHYGPFSFDVGAHAFDMRDPVAARLVWEVLRDNYIEFDARTAFYVCGRFMGDPLGDLTQLARLPLGLLLRGMWDFLWRPKDFSPESLAERARWSYGDTFYRRLVKPVVEKNTLAPCERISVDLAPLMVINFPARKIRLLDLPAKAARRLARRLSGTNGNGADRTRHLYPATGGFEAFVQRLAEMIKESGGRILIGTGIAALKRERGRITGALIGEEETEIDWLVWSGELGALLELLGMARPELEFCSMLILNFEVRGEPICDYHWVECWDPEISMKRFSIPSLLSLDNAPPGWHGISVELPCRFQDTVWSDPAPAVERARDELLRMGVVRRREDFAQVHVERIKVAYPVLELGYREKLRRIAASLETAAENVVLLGNAGALFGKMQNDQIRRAIEAAESIAGRIGSQDKFAARGADEGHSAVSL